MDVLESHWCTRLHLPQVRMRKKKVLGAIRFVCYSRRGRKLRREKKHVTLNWNVWAPWSEHLRKPRICFLSVTSIINHFSAKSTAWWLSLFSHHHCGARHQTFCCCRTAILSIARWQNMCQIIKLVLQNRTTNAMQFVSYLSLARSRSTCERVINQTTGICEQQFPLNGTYRYWVPEVGHFGSEMRIHFPLYGPDNKIEQAR